MIKLQNKNIIVWTNQIKFFFYSNKKKFTELILLLKTLYENKKKLRELKTHLIILIWSGI